MESKLCSFCQKIKSAEEFYKQGDRYESRCKQCKKETRKNKLDQSNTPTSINDNNSASQIITGAEPKNYEDLGFTKEEFLEIVDFFKELVRLDKKEGQNE